MKRFFHTLVASAVILTNGWFLLPKVAYAQASTDQAPASETSAPTEQATAYSFVTPDGCSLTLLTRRALQLYDIDTTTVTLSQAAIIFAETNIVQKMGARQLNVGEKVTIDTNLLKEFAEKSASLTPAQVAAWQTYANRASFDLGYINAEKPAAPAAAQDDQQAKDDAQAKADEQKQQDKNSINSNRVYWALIGLSTIAIVVYLLSGRKTGNRL